VRSGLLGTRKRSIVCYVSGGEVRGLDEKDEGCSVTEGKSDSVKRNRGGITGSKISGGRLNTDLRSTIDTDCQSVRLMGPPPLGINLQYEI